MAEHDDPTGERKDEEVEETDVEETDVEETDQETDVEETDVEETEQETPEEEEATGGDKPKVDAADLKARLGLKKRERKAPKVEHPAAAEEEAEAPSEEEVEAARRRAEEAEAEAGTPVEAFSPLGQETTPIPQRLPGADAPAEQTGGTAKLPLVPMIVTLVVVALVGLFLGQLLGKSLQQRELREEYGALVERKIEYFRGAKTATGKPVLEEIVTMRESLASMVDDLDTVQQKGEDLSTVEKSLTGLVAKLKRYRDENVYISPDGVMDDLMVIYADDPMLAALQFAVDTRHLYDVISAAYDEAATLARIGGPPGSTQRTVMLQRGEREIEVPKGEPEEGEEPETEKVTIPVGEGRLVSDTGRPSKVKLVDPRRDVEVMEWQMMTLPMGEKEPVQVPTYMVGSLDLTPIYKEHQRVVKELMLNRLGQIVRNLHSLASTTRWKPVEDKLRSWEKKE
ncbi:MAG: hypothetical protein ACQEXJ_14835 [Myxococcota bacterium]